MSTHTNHKRSLLLLALLAAVLGFFLLPRPAAAAPLTPTCGTATCTVSLYAKSGLTALPDSTNATVWGFTTGSGDTLTAPGGPTIVVNQGDALTINLTNNLAAAENVALAFPQMSGLVDTVGAAGAGGTRSYSVNTSRPGTYLYEAGNRDEARHQVAMGLYGAIVVLGPADAGYDDEAALVLSEIDPALNASPDPSTFDMENYKAKYWLINGKAYSSTDAIPTNPGNDVLLRYVNAGLNDHSMGVLNLHQRFLANDSRPLGGLAYDAYAETISPGETLDAAVTIPASAPAGSRYVLFDQGLHLDNNSSNWKTTNGATGTLTLGGMMTVLTTTAAGTCSGPTGSSPSATPNAGNFDIQVTFTACAGQTLTGAGYLVDTTSGSPTPLAASGASQTLSFSVPAGAPGLHTVYVRASDTTPATSAWVTITFTTSGPAGDTVGPTTSALGQVFNLTGNTTAGSTTIYSLPSTSNLTIGTTVTGAGVPVGATVTAFGGSFTRVGTTSSGSALVTGLSSTADMAPNMPVSGAGIPAGTKIASLGGAITRTGTTTNGSTVVTGLSSTTSLTAGMPVSASSGIPAGASLVDIGPGGAFTRTVGTRNGSSVITGIAGSDIVNLANGVSVTGTGLSGTPTILTMPGGTVTGTGTRATGSANITGLSSTTMANLAVGMGISRPAGGIPVGTTILSLNPGAGSLVMSANATSPGTNTLTFTYAAGQIRLSANSSAATGPLSRTFSLLANQVRISTAATASGSRSISFHTPTATSITLTANATASGSPTLTFTTPAATSVTISAAATATGTNVSLSFATALTSNGSLTLTATADDTATGGSNIAEAEYWVDSDPGQGNGTAFDPADGNFDSPTEGLTANVTGVPQGAHTLSARSRDAANNWGPVVTVPFRVDTTAPTTTAATIKPNPNNGSQSRDPNVLEVQVDAHVADPTAGGISSTVVAAEGVFDDPGFAQGSGAVFLPTDGAFDSSSEDVYLRIPLSQINALTVGVHTFYVRGKDAAGNWGATTTTTLTIDKTGPVTSGAAVNLQTQTLTASATDAVSAIAAAEWFTGSDPGAGNGTAMQAADGTFNGTTEALTASVFSLPSGVQTISVRAKDAAGNWGAVTTVSYDKLFASTFSNVAGTGTLGTLAGSGQNQWSSRNPTTGSSLSSTTGGLSGTDCCKLSVSLSGTATRYVQDNTPGAESNYRARFYLNPNSALPVSSTAWTTIFVGQNSSGTSVFSVQIQHNTAATYLLRLQALSGTGTGTTLTSASTSIPNAAVTRIEVAWAASPGSVRLWVNGGASEPASPTLSITGINNSTRRIDTVRLGPSAGVPSGSAGTLFFDQFVSTHNTYVGP